MTARTGRADARSLAELAGELHRAAHEPLLEGFVAGCALVACADGWVVDEERERMRNMVRRLSAVGAFGLEDAIVSFEAMVERFAADPEAAEAAALAAVARLRGAGANPALLIETCCAIAAADTCFDAEERLAVIRLCGVLGLDPTDFDLADAP